MRIVRASLASLPDRQRAVATLFLEASPARGDRAARGHDANAARGRFIVRRQARAELNEAGIDAAPSPDEHMIDSLERKDEN